ncbi:MAG: M48 family metallopeptidase [Candidatus Wildermuthbacteria bacterium]|nr:M48 family metallopeptidase [Candidatus Wildermuthbacteria bacterium]
MEQQIKVKNRKIRYAVKISRKARKLRLDAYYDGRFVLTIPKGTTEGIIRTFLREKANWMLKQLLFFKHFKGGIFFRNDQKSYLAYKEKAQKLVEHRLSHFNKLYNLQFHTVRIKNHRTIWGSCSDKKNLNFSYKLLFLPKHIADYIIVHELCHLEAFDHSEKFWKLVGRAVPHYQKIEKELKYTY